MNAEGAFPGKGSGKLKTPPHASPKSFTLEDLREVLDIMEPEMKSEPGMVPVLVA